MFCTKNLRVRLYVMKTITNCVLSLTLPSLSGGKVIKALAKEITAIMGLPMKILYYRLRLTRLINMWHTAYL